ncbi:sugar phosphate isomerase/epimerase family protein [Paludibaculum fermentans]|uniref:sugar phosphate isomerase/epimerase family protein n=1 Tax=Paludibaculum fermentans TaxID=1473598 RepID=UPI003EB7838C
MRSLLSAVLTLSLLSWGAAPTSLQLGHIGIFLRCTGKTDPREALQAVRSLGLRMVQVSKLPDRFYSPEGAKEFAALLNETGVQASAVVAVYDGENYKDIPTIRATVGFVPKAFMDQRVAYTKKCVDLAAALKVKIVTFHVGFLPAQPTDPDYQRLVHAVRDVAQYAAKHSVTISLETGQESADELLQFLGQVAHRNVGVNFDMANLVLYGKDDAPAALRKLLPKVTSVHVKDGLQPEDPARLGAEARLGEGKAGVKECLKMLKAAHFAGPVVIENYVFRGRGTEPMAELALAKAFVDQALAP